MFLYLVDLLLVLIPTLLLIPTYINTYMRNLKIICQGEVCKIDKPPSVSVKTLKYDPRKRWKMKYFEKFFQI